MTPAALAALHARCFTDAPRPWSEGEFADLLGNHKAFLLAENQAGFLLGRVIADEAELLTLAVAPEFRRQGLAARLTARFANEARNRGAVVAFLEVAADNGPAQALYNGLGWQLAGLRKRYFSPTTDAQILRIHL